MRQGKVSVARRVPYNKYIQGVKKYKYKPAPSGRRLVSRSILVPSIPFYNAFVQPFYRGKATKVKEVNKYTRKKK